MPNLVQYPHDKWTIYQNKTGDDYSAATYSPSTEAVQYADYILNHYSRYSHADKLCLAIDLEKRGWKNDNSNIPLKTTMNMTKELSDSLLSACKAAGIESPRYIAQDKSGFVFYYNVKPNMLKRMWLHDDNEVEFGILDHPPYADDWKESLLEWVEPQEEGVWDAWDAWVASQGEPLADVLARHSEHVADVRKKVSGIEALVCEDIAKRQQVGIAKYGTSVAENMLSHTEWLQHAYEESLDMAVYLKRAMAELQTTSGKIEIENEDY